MSSRSTVRPRDNAEKIKGLIFACVGTNEMDERKLREAAQRELQARDWNTVLGIDSPAIECRIQLRRRRWGIRFQSKGHIKSRELRNGQLPPSPKAE